jgi:hypothetical protein
MKLRLAAFASFAALVGSMPAQAAVTGTYDLRGTAGFGLLVGNEPTPSSSTATGGEIGAGIFLDDGGDADPNTNFLTVSNVGWGSSQGFSDLSSPANNSHIHGPTASNNGAGFTQTAGVLINLTRSSNAATGGVFTNAPLSLTAAQVIDLNNGKYYINIHTTINGGGELRGFITLVPEPSTALLGLFGGAALLAFRRRRQTAA